jgi:hypothetical protein
VNYGCVEVTVHSQKNRGTEIIRLPPQVYFTSASQKCLVQQLFRKYFGNAALFDSHSGQKRSPLTWMGKRATEFSSAETKDHVDGSLYLNGVVVQQVGLITPLPHGVDCGLR